MRLSLIHIFRSALLERLNKTELDGTITSEVIEDSNMVTLTVTSPDAEDAKAILDAALEIYPETARFILGRIEFNILNEAEVPREPYNTFSIAPVSYTHLYSLWWKMR